MAIFIMKKQKGKDVSGAIVDGVNDRVARIYMRCKLKTYIPRQLTKSSINCLEPRENIVGVDRDSVVEMSNYEYASRLRTNESNSIYFT